MFCPNCPPIGGESSGSAVRPQRIQVIIAIVLLPFFGAPASGALFRVPAAHSFFSAFLRLCDYSRLRPTSSHHNRIKEFLTLNANYALTCRECVPAAAAMLQTHHNYRNRRYFIAGG